MATHAEQSGVQDARPGGITSLRLYPADYGCLVFLRDYCLSRVVIQGRVSAASIIRWALHRAAEEVQAELEREQRNVTQEK